LKLGICQRFLPWLPALVTLVLVASYRVSVPYYDSWAFVDAYQEWQQGQYGLRELFATHGPHPSVPGKLIYWCALHLTKGDVSWLPLMSWAFSFAAALAIAALIRRTVTDARQRSWLVFLANTLLFTTADGGTRLWDFCFQNYIVGMCLALALMFLAQGGAARHIVGSMVFAVIGALSFGSGFTIAWLLLPLVWLNTASTGTSRARLWTLSCLALSLVLTWVSMVLLPSLGHAHEQGQAAERAESLLSRPLMTIKYLLVVLGGSLGRGTATDPEWLCMIVGAVGVLVFAACLWQLWRRRDEPSLLVKAWPWIACCGFAVLNTLMIALARMGKSYSTALAPRYVVFTAFFMLGVAMLCALLMPRRWTSIAMTSFLSLQVFNWIDGAHAMEHFHHVLLQNRTALTFAKVLPLQPHRVIQHHGPDSVKNAAIFLHDQGRLRNVQMVTDTRLSNLKAAGALTANSAHVDAVGRTSDGNVMLQGTCTGGKGIGDIPALILITAQEPNGDERIVAFNFPTMPSDYFDDSDRRRRQQEHYEGWRVVLDQAPVPTTLGTLLRAYAMGSEGLRIRRIGGEFAVPAK
jgi:hypothetical protein